MDINKRLSLALFASLLTFTSLPAMAITEQQKKMLDQLDQMDHQEFRAQTEKAYVCIHARDFDCAEKKIAKASKYITNPQDRNALRIAKQDLAAERRFKKEEQEAAADRARQIQLAEARTAREEAERRRRDEQAQEEASKTDWFKAGVTIATGAYIGSVTKNLGAEQQMKMVSASMDAVYNGNMEGLDAAAKQVAAEREQAHNAKMQEIREQKARDERAARAQKEREEREERAARAKKEREERAEAQRADSELAGKREAAKKVALASESKRASAERADAQLAAETRQAQENTRIRQQEQERLQKQARLQEQAQEQARQREQERKQEQARKKAEAERAKLAEKQAEEQARALYLKSIAAGSRLVATKCPDGEGKYYATGTRPRIKPEVVSCVDVRYRAYCPGDTLHYSEGTAHNFIGMSGCFGDTYDINPKPPCKVDQVRIEVIEARGCGN